MSQSQVPQIEAATRERVGSIQSKRLRAAGQLPAVVYGHKQDPVHVSVDQKEMTGLLHDWAHLIELKLADKSETCLIKDVQWDVYGTHVMHIDFTHGGGEN